MEGSEGSPSERSQGWCPASEQNLVSGSECEGVVTRAGLTRGRQGLGLQVEIVERMQIYSLSKRLLKFLSMS